VLRHRGVGHQHHVFAVLARAQQARQFVAAHVRHEQVDDDQVGLQVVGRGQRIAAAVGRHRVAAFGLEQHHECVCGVAVVVDDQHPLLPSLVHQVLPEFVSIGKVRTR
jgi:hypothetical protein